ncbi:MAG: VOC family protein [Phaeospirillum sp.]|nr:VOC family protein [Phaeospirillum sp.]
MSSHITGLDHIILAVRDLDAATATFQRLGFTLSTRGEHAEWGTANRCLMFGDDYIELLSAVAEGEPAARLRAFTHAREGLMGLVFGSADAAADAERLGLEPPGSLSRTVATTEGAAVARFVAGVLPPETTPGIASFLCQHLTPELLRQPGWTDHANTVTGIASVTALMADPVAEMAAWDRLIGPAAATATDDTVTIHTGHGLVFLCRPEDLDQLHPEAEDEPSPPPPALVAMTLAVANADTAAAVLRANGVAYSRDPDGNLRIAASECCGVFIEMVG